MVIYLEKKELKANVNSGLAIKRARSAGSNGPVGNVVVAFGAACATE